MTESHTDRNPVVWEFRLFLTAVMFYSRIPVPAWVGYSTEQLNRSTRYFPAIGWIVGTVVAGVYAGSQVILPNIVAVVLALISGVLLTGAFHEDGFADICDGFGGGVNKERTLEIMKDSRVGAYAVIGTVLLLALKITTLAELGKAGLSIIVLAIIYAAVLSRWMIVTIIFRDQYARDDLSSKVKPIAVQLTGPAMVVATVWLVPFLALGWWHPWWLVAVPIAFVVRLILARWFRKRLGGYTGDCLGAAQQIIELTILLTVLSIITI